ncbi:uncharacterized protein V6R79_005857 [Siganus canaliculatus]
MALLLLLVLPAAVTAFGSETDLSGQMFTFPEETNTDYVTVSAAIQDFDATTVCLRFMTDVRREQYPFSLATSAVTNAFNIFIESRDDEILLDIDDSEITFGGLDIKLNVWHSLCVTWDSNTGLLQLWFNGNPSVRKLAAGPAISGPTIILGQDQDSVGGGFDTDQSFVGMLTDVHMWNYILSACEIQRYVDSLNFTPGNVLNWKALDHVTTGDVVEEDVQLHHKLSCEDDTVMACEESVPPGKLDIEI